MDVNFFPSHIELPYTGFQGKTLSYFSTDIPQNQIATTYDVHYTMNSNGFRSVEFDHRGRINIMVIGCSISFGNGIPSDRRFGEVFANKLSVATGEQVVVHNLSWPGESPDYVARMACIAVPIMKPDILLTTFPHAARREYFDIMGNRYDHRPVRDTSDRVDRINHHHLTSLASDYEDAVNLFRNYKLIEFLTIAHGVKWMYSILKINSKPYFKYVNYYDRTIKSPSMVKTDFARDGGHPGVLTNLKMADDYFRTYMEKYG